MHTIYNATIESIKMHHGKGPGASVIKIALDFSYSRQWFGYLAHAETLSNVGKVYLGSIGAKCDPG